MLPSSPLVLRALRSPSCWALPAVCFSTTTLRTEKVTAKISRPTSSRSQVQLPYFIHRSKTNNLPVYEELKRGGTLKLTRIRNVEGDSNALRKDVIEKLGLDEEMVKVSGITKHIIIKAWIKKDIKKMLKDLRF